MIINYSLTAILIGVLGFSLKSIFIKLAYLNGISPVALMSYRMILAMPFFILAYFLFGEKREKNEKHSFRGVVACAILYYISSYSDMLGLNITSVSMERIILFTIPVFVLIISSIFLKKRFSKKTYFFSLLSWVGVAVAFLGNTSVNSISGSSSGVLFIFVSAISYASYFIISGEEMKKIGFITFNSQVMTLACILSLIPMLIKYRTSELHVELLVIMKFPLMLAIFSTVTPHF